MTLDFPWWLAALLYLMAIAIYFGTGAALGFLCTYLTLRPSDKFDDEQRHPRSTALGFSTLGALAGGALNFVLVWLITVA